MSSLALGVGLARALSRAGEAGVPPTLVCEESQCAAEAAVVDVRHLAGAGGGVGGFEEMPGHGARQLLFLPTHRALIVALLGRRG